MRSQDKESLRIVSSINLTQEDGKNFICNYTGIANIKLGAYKTKERALEILEEIQRILMYEWDYKDKFSMTRVYIMPEE